MWCGMVLQEKLQTELRDGEEALELKEWRVKLSKDLRERVDFKRMAEFQFQPGPTININSFNKNNKRYFWFGYVLSSNPSCKSNTILTFSLNSISVAERFGLSGSIF